MGTLQADDKIRAIRQRCGCCVVRIALAIGLMIGADTALADCAPPADQPQLCLFGVVTAADLGVAVIENAGQPGLVEIRTGDEIDGWSVSEIQPRAVVIAKQGESMRLTLGDGSGKSTVPLTLARRRGPMRHSRHLEARGERDPNG